MRKIISISETLCVPHTEKHIQANADALFNEQTGEMEVRLHAELPEAISEVLQPLVSQVVHAKVSLEEAIPAAKDIFHSWIRRLTQTGFVAVEN